jgi:CheY-like chemotaxis protein
MLPAHAVPPSEAPDSVPTPALPEPAAQPSTPGGARILLAEDGPDNQRLFRHFLRKAGMQVEIAGNGRVAYEMAIGAAAAGAPFDVILMDMQMPEMDGYQATAQLRKAGYHGPILALTAFAQSTDRAKCLAAGCDEFLSKPIGADQLVLAVRRQLDAGRPAPEEGKHEQGQERAREPEPAAEPLVSELADEPELRELIARYVAALPERAAALERSLAGGDLQTLGKQAHDLKGTAGTYGFPSLTHEAGILEVTVRHGCPSTEIHEHVARLIDLCRRARATRREASPRI